MHGISFHYFCDEGSSAVHVPCQGALTGSRFDAFLTELETSVELLTPEEFLRGILSGQQTADGVCLCFYCGLKSQLDIALPILEKHGRKAFWFLYTGMLDGGVVKVEEYHHFRFFCFDGVEDFYRAFFAAACRCLGTQDYAAARGAYEASGYLSWSDYYTDADKWFKYLRDRVLGNEKFEPIMDAMMESRGYRVEDHRHNLWLTPEEIRRLSDGGHMIGLHTHTHPYDMASLSAGAQREEYGRNKALLEEITGKPVVAMAHPCNSYTGETLNILEEMGILLGFRSNYDPAFTGNLELPCVDNASIIRFGGRIHGN